MRPDEYAAHDAVSLAEFVRAGDVTPAELQECALAAHEQMRETVNAVVDVHPLDADRLSATGPLAGVPTLIKDLFHGQVGSVCGNGSRLSEGWEVTSATQIYERTVAAGDDADGEIDDVGVRDHGHDRDAGAGHHPLAVEP